MTFKYISIGIGLVGTLLNVAYQDWNAAVWSFSYMLIASTLED